eukprot:3433816-Karenia_brevis.AAC.1
MPPSTDHRFFPGKAKCKPKSFQNKKEIAHEHACNRSVPSMKLTIPIAERKNNIHNHTSQKVHEKDCVRHFDMHTKLDPEI